MHMAKVFPTLSEPDEQGRRGLFIGEHHTDLRYLDQLYDKWDELEQVIDVIFFEAFSCESTPGTSYAAIQQQLKEHTDDYWNTPSLMKGPGLYFDIMQLASSLGRRKVHVRGLETRRLQSSPFRGLVSFHMHWAANIYRQLDELGVKRYAIFAGMAHGQSCRMTMGIPCYSLKADNEFHEYVTVFGPGNLAIWMP
jgi:hypothetical protein